MNLICHSGKLCSIFSLVLDIRWFILNRNYREVGILASAACQYSMLYFFRFLWAWHNLGTYTRFSPSFVKSKQIFVSVIDLPIFVLCLDQFLKLKGMKSMKLLHFTLWVIEIQSCWQLCQRLINFLIICFVVVFLFISFVFWNCYGIRVCVCVYVCVLSQNMCKNMLVMLSKFISNLK